VTFLQKDISKKSVHKTLVKSTHESLSPVRLCPNDLIVFFALLGSTQIKAGCKHLDKIDPGIITKGFLVISNLPTPKIVRHSDIQLRFTSQTDIFMLLCLL